MKHKKTFWRGFGSGVLFAAVILGISCLIRTSDAQVVARAKKLGMAYETSDRTVLASKSKEKNDKKTESASQTPASTEQPTPSVAPASSEDPSKVPTPEPANDTKDDTSSQKTSKKSLDNSEKMQDEKKKMEKEIKESAVKLEIETGDVSEKVSRKLERLGLVDDAKAFNRYMNRNGYSKNIAAGTFSISPDDSYRDIAKKITR